MLLLDRKDFPRDKSCGDGVPARATEILFEFGLQEKLAAASFYVVSKVRLVSPKGYNVDFDFPLKAGAEAFIASRREFDSLLQQHAVESGAEFCRAQVEGPLLKDGRVVGVRARENGRSLELRAQVVIAADGATSAIARAILPQKFRDKHRAVALRAYIDDLVALPNQVEFYLYKDLLPGYGWVFPHGSHTANIGVGMRLDRFRQCGRSLEDMLQVLVESPAIKQRQLHGGQLRDLAAWSMNLGSQWIQRAYDGALLVGDAGGFVNPLTGGGIRNAFLSGRLAAQVASAALAKGDVSRRTLQEYDQLCHTAFRNDMRRSYLIQLLMLRMPVLLDWLIQRMSADSQFAQIFANNL